MPVYYLFILSVCIELSTYIRLMLYCENIL